MASSRASKTSSDCESDPSFDVSGHEYYRELCALLPLGSLSESECRQLTEHLAQCDACSKECGEYIDLVQNKLPLIAPARTARIFLRYPFVSKSRLKQGFLNKAIRKGVNFSDDVTGPRNWLGPGRSGVYARLMSGRAIPALVAVVVAMFIGTLALIRHDNRLPQSPRGQEQTSQVLPEQIQQPSKEPAPAGGTESKAHRADQSGTGENYAAQLDRLRGEYEAAVARTQELQGLLDQAKADHQSVEVNSLTLAKELEERRKQNSQLLADLQAKERNLTEAREQLESAQRKVEAGQALLAVYREQADDLSSRLREISGKYDKDVGLLAADRDIRDLMGARNLHIIDVSDVDGRGRTHHTFGRIFYTEHRSLIFYAFDLENKPDAAHSFQAWGCRQPDPERARNLGIFYTDDKRQNRWVLKYTDPSILAEIDAVFVTVEPPGGSSKPTGHKMLYALLGGNRPNHP